VSGDTTAADAEARQHMLWAPDHELTIGLDDEWHCLTCEQAEDDTEDDDGDDDA